VSLKSLLKHHSSGCLSVGPTGPTGPTPVAALSSAATGPRAGAAAWSGSMSCAAPAHFVAPPLCVAPPHCAAHHGTSNLSFR
jgi:hypothetical protein